MKIFTCRNCRVLEKVRTMTWLRELAPSKRTTFMRINLIAFFVSITIMHVGAAANAQNISLNFRQAKMEDVFRSIKKQCGYQFLYNNSELKKARPVSVTIKNVKLSDALEAVFEEQPLDYQILDKTIVIKERAAKSRQDVEKTNFRQSVTGKVTDNKSQPLSGVSVTVKGMGKGTMTDNSGQYRIEAEPNSILVFSFVGFEQQEVPANNRAVVNIVLMESSSQLDQVQVIGYGTASRRLNTGAVTTVTAAELSQQTVSNPLQALGGRVPGMYVQSNGGMAGSNLTIQIRGVNSIAAGNNPLYIVDGVPFGSGAYDLISPAVTTNIAGGLSPFAVLNPSDIESIEILKDADATAIYGSRAANGVVLITTKKGSADATRLSVNISQGYGKVANFIDMLGVADYLQLRKYAFANSSVTPTAVNAPDLLSWDQNRDINWQKEIIGGTAGYTDAQASITGGNGNTRFVLSGSYRAEGSVLPVDVNDKKGTARLNIDHHSANNKFRINANMSFALDKNKLITDPTPSLNLPPNYPIYDANGKIIFRPTINVETYGILQTPFENKTNTFIGNTVLSYDITSSLSLKSNVGYTQIGLDQIQKYPSAYQDPAVGTLSYNYVGESKVKTWIAEPQVNFKRQYPFGKIEALAGMTFQQSQSQATRLSGSDYTSDALLGNIASAGTIRISSNQDIDYRYVSVFGRLNYNLKDRYIINGTFRRDGSSRFGEGRRFGNFGAVGAAWLFGNEPYIKEELAFLSYGKLRGSYGITGNDQITDYQYLSSYSGTTNAYQVPGLRVSRIANPDYSWETNKKLEFALDLGFIKDRILLSAAYYRNRSGNMLVNYPLSGQTGFTSYQANLPAVVQNSGWELTVSTANIKTADFNWSSGFNITIPKNKLIAFPGIESTSYGTNNLVVGQSLNLLWGYHYLGVNPQTGLAIIADIDNSGTISSTSDFVNFGSTLPKYYGGFTNSFSYKRFQLDVMFQFAKKLSMTPLRAWSTIPGSIRNIPTAIYEDMWKQPGDEASIPKALTAGTTQYMLSDKGAYEDGSYIRLKTLNLSYRFGGNWLKKLSLNTVRLYVQGQNLFTVTSYSGLDPEASSPVVLPNLRVITTGIQIDL